VAASYDKTDIVKLLLNRGANIEAKGYRGKTALMEAALNGHAATVSLLLHRGAKINAIDNERNTALMWAARNGHQDIVQMLQRWPSASLRKRR
jgi:ankyrin repeat protein